MKNFKFIYDLKQTVATPEVVDSNLRSLFNILGINNVSFQTILPDETRSSVLSVHTDLANDNALVWYISAWFESLGIKCVVHTNSGCKVSLHDVSSKHLTPYASKVLNRYSPILPTRQDDPTKTHILFHPTQDPAYDSYVIISPKVPLSVFNDIIPAVVPTGYYKRISLQTCYLYMSKDVFILLQNATTYPTLTVKPREKKFSLPSYSWLPVVPVLGFAPAYTGVIIAVFIIYFLGLIKQRADEYFFEASKRMFKFLMIIFLVAIPILVIYDYLDSIPFDQPIPYLPTYVNNLLLNITTDLSRYSEVELGYLQTGYYQLNHTMFCQIFNYLKPKSTEACYAFVINEPPSKLPEQLLILSIIVTSIILVLLIINLFLNQIASITKNGTFQLTLAKRYIPTLLKSEDTIQQLPLSYINGQCSKRVSLLSPGNYNSLASFKNFPCYLIIDIVTGVQI